ncbi:uncharacterized protein LOC131624876 [Vicia villosa]|uniref:uncharacterized protein LOC131624876 n=1 Tax=Vicia villosa TaxID=3911 RepID=UPI00273ACD91|nr:uncharacterized protein LOC131624876 [Vicia villosa]
MKFYTRTGRVATINADIEAARRIFDASVKGLQLIAPPTSSNKKPRAEDKHPREDQHQTTDVSSVDLDARFTEEELKKGEEARPKVAHPVRPVPDGDFELVPLGDNPDKAVKIGKGIPDLPRKQLVACLRANADLRALKAQALADFVAEMTSIANPLALAENKWTIYVDGASSSSRSGAGIILENDEGLIIEVSLVLSFNTSNNQAEYEALLAGLRLAEDIGAREVKIYTDSQLVASQISGDYQAKNNVLAEYLTLVKDKMKKFAKAEVEHIPREHNSRAGVLSKLASTRKKGGNKSVIQEILSRPSVDKGAQPLPVLAISDNNCWMTPVYNFLTKDELPTDAKEASAIKRRACSYTIVENKLYRRGFSIPLLKCVDASQALEILQELHEGISGQHLGGRSLARKALRAGYYWPTMQQNAREHVQKCDKCQRHADMHLAPPNELKSSSSPWPFSTWGMDLLGPFPVGSYQNKYLAIITDNGTQFTDRKFQEFMAKLETKQHFTSVEHPQTNGQAEAANRVILRGLKRRLGEAKKAWVEELHSVLWAYRTTPHSSTGETPFRLTYGTEAMIPVEIREPSRRTESPLEEELNDEAMREELNMVEEIRAGSSLREAKLKQQIALRHNAKVIKRDIEHK